MIRRKKAAKKNFWFSKKLVCGLIGLFTILLMNHVFSSFFYGFTTVVSHPLRLKAAIVDQLGLTVPNQTFINSVKKILKEAGYIVDYYPSKDVTVELYRNLPTHGYKLIILRVHSALVSAKDPPVTLFTSEPYSQSKYIYEQLTDQLGWVTYRFENGRPTEPTYFGISPLFVKQSMLGEFQDTIIIMMGCNGLTYTYMAKAFIEKGAKVYIGWSDTVLASHSDATVVYLLRNFLLHKQTLEKSLQKTFQKVRFNQAYRSLLMYYPFEAGNYSILDA
jgi:hypothetical protein